MANYQKYKDIFIQRKSADGRQFEEYPLIVAPNSVLITNPNQDLVLVNTASFLAGTSIAENAIHAFVSDQSTVATSSIYATQSLYATSSIYANTASYLIGGAGTIIDSGSSWNITSSWAITSSYSISSSRAGIANSASYTFTSSNAVSASYAGSASYLVGGSGTTLESGSTYNITASWAELSDTAISASYLSGSDAVVFSVFFDSGSANTVTMSNYFGHLRIANNSQSPRLYFQGTDRISAPIGVGFGNDIAIDGPLRIWREVSHTQGYGDIYAGQISASVVTASLFYGTASHSKTASYALNSPVVIDSGSLWNITSSKSISSSYSTTASYVATSSYSHTSSYAITQSTIHADIAATTVGSDFALLAGEAIHATSASYAETASVFFASGSSGSVYISGEVFTGSRTLVPGQFLKLIINGQTRYIQLYS